MRLAALVAVAAAVCACASGSGRAAGQRDLSAYEGLATWVDVYDAGVWANPERAVATMARQGVRTLFLETGNDSRRTDVFRPDRVSRFLVAAHLNGLRVVAWYVPSFARPARDLRRSLAAIRFRTAGGEAFDSFALDIEGRVVRSPSLRSARAVRLARELRAEAPYLALGAIVPSPRGMQLLPSYWPGFPFAALARSLDVFLPMGYFTYRPRYPGGSGAYTRANIDLLREATGDPGLPVHAIGGLAHAATPKQVRAFEQAARAGGAIGASLYDFAGTGVRQWPELRAANRLS
jgi:hypothetical protein